MGDVKQPVLHTPDYDVDAVQIGVVHIGLGAFHRAHQAYYLDHYMEKTGDLRWGVAAVNLRAADSELFEKAAANDGYVLKTLSTSGETSYRLMRCHRRYADWTKDLQGAVDLIGLSSVKMVTITVTESGYSLNNDGTLNAVDPVIATEVSGGAQTTIYAYLRAALTRREKTSAGRLTILCCDNLRGNGHLLKQNFARYLTLCEDHDLLAWVAKNVTFPASMVDRITPKPSADLEREIEGLFGRKNDAVVLGEDFIQWVIEDNFATDRPDLGLVGVSVVDDIDPYEETKIRVLNGGHTCLTYLGALGGYKSYDELMNDPVLFDHYWSYETREVLPALTIELPFDKMAYLETVTRRFKNRHIADSVERICADGFAKFPIFIAPTLRGCFEQQIIPLFGFWSVASWYVFAKRVTSGHLNVRYFEPSLEELRPLIEDGNARLFAESQTLWGDLPTLYPDFIPELLSAIDEMEKAWPMSA